MSCTGNDDADNKQFDHSHAKSTDMVKHLFEHEFAEQCIAKETANLVHEETKNRLQIADSCMCIAINLFKDLTAKDSYTLLKDKKHAKSLRKKYEEAANHCL